MQLIDERFIEVTSMDSQSPKDTFGELRFASLVEDLL
jgi:hypothetical protein